jgi:tol-pal system protein YbgF
LNFVRSSAVIAIIGLGLATPAAAQSASEMAVRMQALEEQVRNLMGQVEELNYEVQQLKNANGKSGALEQPVTAAPRQLAAAPAPEPADAMPSATDGVETIEQQPLMRLDQAADDSELPSAAAAPGPQILGSIGTAAAHPGDGGFQGKVLVSPSQQEPGDDVYLDPGMAQDGTADDSIETVSLSPESPEALYEHSNESLLRRQFSDAEAGFSTFLSKYPDHGLAGSAQYWLGETYYAQRDYRRAAQTFLQGYKKYPKSRRAADSLLKLGVSLGRLGQTQQACAAYAAVNAEYPKAVEARRRAQAESKRAGCAS